MTNIDDIETIILRFRDLVCNNTTSQHENVIAIKGYVWWGWWAKVQETIPPTAFSSLCRKIKEKNSIDVFLFDSGTLKIYKAKCEAIKYETDSSACLSPEQDATPEYYRNQRYLAWFMMTSITEVDSSTLLDFTYIDIDEFFLDGISSFNSFNDKVIFSTNELQEQQRTIWFVRKKKAEDLIHEIHSYSLNSFGTGNADTLFRMLTSPNLLWLSDTHFSDEHHAFTDTETENNSLGFNLTKVLKSINILPSAAIISGDLTFKAAKNEFDMAENFIGYLNSCYSLDGPLYAVCPGNHDLAFSVNPDKADSKITKTYSDAKKNYSTFYCKLYGFSPNEEMYSIRRFLTPDLIPIEIICVNSCYLQQTADKFQGLGYVGSNQMQKIKQKLNLTNAASPLRIMVMHHHLLPVMYKEVPEYNKVYSLTLDAEAVSQFVLDCNIKVVLHGHNHKEFYSEIIRKCKGCKDINKKKFYIVGLGSTGVKQSELSDGRTNMFAILKITKNALTITGYGLLPSGEQSEIIFEHTIPMREEENNV